jgi:hypothetical protein
MMRQPTTGGLTSVMSFPERGPYGSSKYRGNTSGLPILELIKHYKPRLVCDPACGSGTTGEVVTDLNEQGHQIEYYGFDLRDGFNLLRDRLIERLPRAADYLFLHPPYHSMVRYSGPQGMWGRDRAPHPDDLSNCATYEEFLCKLEVALFNCWEATRNQGVYSVMIGDLRRTEGGVRRYYSMQADIIKMAPGSLEGVIIKEQHNCVSNGRSYAGSFIPIMHEYILNFRRDQMVFGMLDATLDISSRLRTLSNATWYALCDYALRRLGGEADLPSIYEVIEETAPDKTVRRPNWQARVRAALQERHRSTARGRWALSGEAVAA